MSSNDGNKVVLLENFLDWLKAEFNRALTLDILAEAHLASLFIVHGVRPKQIAQESVERWLDKSINVVNVLFLHQLRGDTAMHTQVVTIDISRNGQGFE